MKNKTIVNYVCEVNYPSSSAYGIHVLKMCNALVKNTTTVNLFTPNISISNLKLKKNYNIKNKFNLIKIFREKTKINFLSRILFSIKILRNSLAKSNSNRSFFLSRSVLFSLFASLLKRKVILELHHDLSGFTKFIFFFMKKIGFLKDLKYIFIHRNLIKKIKPSKKSYICLDDAVDVTDFNIKNKIIKNKTCIYVGSFYPGKGIEKIFNLAKKLKHINFHLFGDKKFLPEYKLYKNLKIFNFIPYKKIPNILSNYEVALMPYENKVLGRLKNVNLVNYMSPLKMFDYLASSKIILASDLKVYNHILKHKYNSILIKNSNLEDWEFWINKIFNSKKRFEYLKKNAQKTAMQYTWVNRSEKILKFAKNKFF